MKMMINRIKMRLIGICLMILATAVGAVAQTIDAKQLNRPIDEYDITAYCQYSSFHPSHYILDNNWDILCFYRTPATLHDLRAAGINATKSQLRLLRVGGLLECSEVNDSTIYHTVMPILSEAQTDEIRRASKAMADSFIVVNKSSFGALISLFKEKGWERQIYSLVFSALLDSYIWDDTRIVRAGDMTDHGSWSGAYWAMYNKREAMKCGTNSYGPIKCNWSDALAYWAGDKRLIRAANNIIASQNPIITDKAMAEELSQWGICDAEGKIIVPVIYRGSGDDVDRMCNHISDGLCVAVKAKAEAFMRQYGIANKDEAEVILYHELMLDVIAILEEQGIVTLPAILKGEEVGKAHFGDIVFISL